MEKVIYNFGGSFPTPWGDFMAEDKNNPHVTINGNEDSKSMSDPEEGPNGIWIDIAITEDKIDENTAKEEINNTLQYFHHTHDNFDVEIIATGAIINI